jgi:hypothetical protein
VCVIDSSWGTTLSNYSSKADTSTRIISLRFSQESKKMTLAGVTSLRRVSVSNPPCSAFLRRSIFERE